MVVVQVSVNPLTDKVDAVADDISFTVLFVEFAWMIAKPVCVVSEEPALVVIAKYIPALRVMLTVPAVCKE